MHVSTLGVLPQQPNKQAITASVKVLKALCMMRKIMYNRHISGAMISKNKKAATIFNTLNNILITNEINGTARMMH